LSGTDDTHRDDPCTWALDRIKEMVARGQDPLADTHLAGHLRDCPPCDKWELSRRVQVLIAVRCAKEGAPEPLSLRIRSILESEEPGSAQA
jgi:hypothetical protein